MKFKVGDKIKYQDFLVERKPSLAGIFVVDAVEEGEHAGCNLVYSSDFWPAGKTWITPPGFVGAKRDFFCSADFELAE